jgi:hypothetical protein
MDTMQEADILSLIMSSALSIASILFGLYGILLVQYEQARSQLSRHTLAYGALVKTMPFAIGLGFCAAILAFMKLDGDTRVFLWLIPETTIFPLIICLLYATIVAPMLILIIFWVLYAK